MPERHRSVLVPLDLTPGSDRVVGRVALLPLAPDSRVTLLHVVPGGLRPRDRRSAERDARKALAYEMRLLRQSSAAARIQSAVKVGDVAQQIAAHAHAVKAELVVMGRNGSRALRDWVLGATAERVIRQSRLPVLVARLRPRADYTRPAIALDFDRAAHDLVLPMLRILRAPRPRVAVIHAFSDPYDGLKYSSLAEHEADERLTRRQIEVSAAVAKLLAASLARAKLRPEDGPVWESHIRHGSPRVIIRRALRAIEPDLLALGTRGSSAVARMFIGTVSGDVLRAARCDVLVVPHAPRSGRARG